MIPLRLKLFLIFECRKGWAWCLMLKVRFSVRSVPNQGSRIRPHAGYCWWKGFIRKWRKPKWLRCGPGVFYLPSWTPVELDPAASHESGTHIQDSYFIHISYKIRTLSKKSKNSTGTMRKALQAMNLFLFVKQRI